jgi:hypothetical protein
MDMSDQLPAGPAAVIDAINAHDLSAFLAPFSHDALVNDHHRLFRGMGAIHAWAQAEIIGANLSVSIDDVREHYGDIIATATPSGAADRSGQLAFHFYLRGATVVQLVLIPFAGTKEAAAA